MTIESIIAGEKNWAETTKHGKFTIAELREAFKAVEPAGNWKNRIYASVPPSKAEITAAACDFMVGGPTKTVKLIDGFVRIINAGYYANIGA